MTEKTQDKGLAIVTGGSRGIGRATCLQLAKDGYSVAVGYVTGADGARDTVDTIRRDGGKAEAFAADMGDPDAIERLFAQAEEEFGTVRLLVANAGILGDVQRIDAQTAAALQRLFAVNVVGTILCAQQAVRRMSSRHGGTGGTVVLLSSAAARLGGLSGLSAYGASKGAIETVVRGLSNEVSGEGVRVVGVAPGVIQTDMTSPDAQVAAKTGTPMGRVGQPDELAAAIAWLASPAASYVTGTVLTVSGGR